MLNSALDPCRIISFYLSNLDISLAHIKLLLCGSLLIYAGLLLRYDLIDSYLRSYIKLNVVLFYYTQSFNILVGGTLINMIIALILMNVNVLLLREMVLLIIVVLHYNYSSELKEFLEEDALISGRVKLDHPLLEYDWVLTCGMVVSIFVYTFWVYLGDWGFILYCYLAVPYIMIYTVYRTYYLYALFTTPSVKKYFDIRSTVRGRGIRAFSSSSSYLHVGKACLSYGMWGLTATIVGPKILNGDPMYRGDLVNEIVYSNIKIRTRNDMIGMQAAYYLEHFPKDYPKLTDKDGWVKPVVLRDLSNQHKCYHPAYKFTVDHTFSWPWFRGKK